MKKSEFVPTIAPIVQKVNKARGNKLFNSVVIAQAVIETGWGQSNIMMKANAIFGIKATTDWKGKVYNAKTSEVYDGINYTEITACFRAYDSLEESINDYFNLILGLSRYSKALNADSPRACIQAIKDGGYATSPTYVDNVMTIINANNLTKYDTEDVTGNVSHETTEDIKVGDKVKVIKAVQYNGETFKSYYDTYDVIEVSGDRIVIGIGQTVTCAINKSNILKVGSTTDNVSHETTEDIKVGDKVKVIKAVQYNGETFKSYYDTYDVIEVSGDRIVIGIGQTVTCATNKSNITKV